MLKCLLITLRHYRFKRMQVGSLWRSHDVYQLSWYFFMYLCRRLFHWTGVGRFRVWWRNDVMQR